MGQPIPDLFFPLNINSSLFLRPFCAWAIGLHVRERSREVELVQVAPNCVPSVPERYNSNIIIRGVGDEDQMGFSHFPDAGRPHVLLVDLRVQLSYG